jgi:hypothetical protein
MMIKKMLCTHSLFLFFLLLSLHLFAQPDRWQQKVKYTMNIDMNVQTNRYKGSQKLEYWNNSSDTLDRVFYHLYWNAFQPGSMMDTRSQRQGTIVLGRDKNGNIVQDWDTRVRDRIANLKEDEIGYQKVASVKMNGRPQKMQVHETILEVNLDKPILPKSKVSFDMEWDAQVPLQIRRSGRDNPTTNVRYSMSQWYPKMVEYDDEGWHPTPYVGREFYGVWGDFDVTINIDKSYILGGTGYLQNPNTIGYGYEDKGMKVVRPNGNNLSWRFIAPNVHDFVWAADPEFVHLFKKINNRTTIHVLYDATDQRKADWEAIIPKMMKAFPFIEKNFGAYPYQQYSFIHGGDGGMEYPMATLVSGPGDAVIYHELMHSWYQGMLGTNESLYHWMDEGFATFAENRVMQFMNGEQNLQAAEYEAYFNIVRSGKEEPMITHADHFNTNYAYGIASYRKGAIFLEQLGYVVGAPVRDRILLEYYRQWKFKHPNPNDLLRIAEKESGIILDWYIQYWVNTTHTIDYSIDSLWEASGATNIRLRRIAPMPMPIDVKLTFKDGSSEWHYVPMYLMFGAKAPEEGQTPRKIYDAWKWTHATYQISTTHRLTDIVSVEIDPSQRMADIDRKNNRLELKW